MKSSITHALHTGIIINHVRFHLTFKNNYKQMKSSMMSMSHTGMIIYHARFHVALKKKF
jgi:hypothetical protein